jgi:hypothetical protein
MHKVTACGGIPEKRLYRRFNKFSFSPGSQLHVYITLFLLPDGGDVPVIGMSRVEDGFPRQSGQL